MRGVPMSAAQASRLQQLVVARLGFDVAGTVSFLSHSCKATCLSWLAKAAENVEDRQVLSSQVNPANKMAQEYSRDTLAGPLRRLEAACSFIRDRQFDPDTTRSGRWLQARLAGSPPGDVGCGAPQAIKDDQESGRSSNSSSIFGGQNLWLGGGRRRGHGRLRRGARAG